jgi:RNA polymerase sigma-70 factor (sigma-E family)
MQPDLMDVDFAEVGLRGGGRIVQADPDAEFNAFVRARTGALLRTAYLLTGDRHLAEDLVQDALARTHRAMRRLTSDGHIEAYTRIAMYHLHLRRWQRRKVPEVLPGELFEPRDPAGDHAVQISLRVSLHQALAQLTRRQRLVLVLRYFEDKTERETADLLACSVGTVKSQSSRALARLRELAPELNGAAANGRSSGEVA